MNKPYLPNLTALRGIAAILVATLHFHFFLGGIVPYKNAGLVDKLYLMVDLFFILSGFIMCYVYERDFEITISKKKYKNFLKARLARIYPLHLITLSAEFLIFLFLSAVDKFHILPNWHQHLYRLDAIPVQLVFLQTVGIFNFDTWNAPAWSLSAEWWAYIIFPFLFLLFYRIGYKKWFVVTSIAILGWITIEFVLSPLQPFMSSPPNPKNISLDVNWYFGTIRGIVGFIAGMSVWQLYKRSKFKKILGNGWALAIISMTCLIAMQMKLYDTLTVTLFPILILSTAYGSVSINRFFSWKVFNSLGKWSFSIYMWHMVLINLFMLFYIVNREEPIKGLLRPIHGTFTEKRIYLVVFLIVISFIGYLSYTFIENPMRKWLKGKK